MDEFGLALISPPLFLLQRAVIDTAIKASFHEVQAENRVEKRLVKCICSPLSD